MALIRMYSHGQVIELPEESIYKPFERNEMTQETTQRWIAERAERFIGALEFGAMDRKKALDAMKPFGVYSYNTLDKVIGAAKELAKQQGRRVYTFLNPTTYELQEVQLPFTDNQATDDGWRYEKRNEPLA